MARPWRSRSLAVAALLPFVCQAQCGTAYAGAVPASAAAATQKAAVAGLISVERARGNKDVEDPSCFIVETYAQCSFAMHNGDEDVNEWLHLKNGKWVFLGQAFEVTFDRGIMKYGSVESMIEKQYGIPASVAKQFAKKFR